MEYNHFFHKKTDNLRKIAYLCPQIQNLAIEDIEDATNSAETIYF